MDAMRMFLGGFALLKWDSWGLSSWSLKCPWPAVS